MLLLNMLALLTYTLVERQARHSGLALTTRRLIERLDSLTVIETEAVDGSFFYRLTPLTPEQADLIAALRHLFPPEVVPTRLPEPTPTAPEAQLPARNLLFWEASGST